MFELAMTATCAIEVSTVGFGKFDCLPKLSPAKRNISALLTINHQLFPYFLYAGTSGKAGGSRPSSSSSSLLNARPAGVITRAVTKMTRFRLIC
jgi:hypothetical protein